MLLLIFFFNDTATTEIYTLSLHDALPISFLREPQDYALVGSDLAERLLEQNVVYVEATLSVGVMLLRKQQAEANFAALLHSTEPFERRGLRFRWVFDAVRQFGAAAAMAVVETAKTCKSKTIVAFGIGGDQLQVDTPPVRGGYEQIGRASCRERG